MEFYKGSSCEDMTGRNTASGGGSDLSTAVRGHIVENGNTLNPGSVGSGDDTGGHDCTEQTILPASTDIWIVSDNACTY